MTHTEKPTRSLTFWILFLAVEQFRDFRKTCSPSTNPSDVFPGICFRDIATALITRGLIDRTIGATGTGRANTVLQHLRTLAGLGLLFHRPGEPDIYIPNAQAENLYGALEAEGLMPYFMCRDLSSTRKLPEMALYALLRRVPATRGEWNLSNLTRLSAIGEPDRVRDALTHIGNWIEVKRNGKTERVRLRTLFITPTTVRVTAEDQVVRDSASSVMDQLDGPPTGAQGPQGPQGSAGPTGDPDAPFEVLDPRPASTASTAASQGQVEPASAATPAAEDTSPGSREQAEPRWCGTEVPTGTLEADCTPPDAETCDGGEQAATEEPEVQDPGDLIRKLRRQAINAHFSSRAIGGVLRSLGSLFHNLSLIIDPPR